MEVSSIFFKCEADDSSSCCIYSPNSGIYSPMGYKYCQIEENTVRSHLNTVQHPKPAGCPSMGKRRPALSAFFSRQQLF